MCFSKLHLGRTLVYHSLCPDPSLSTFFSQDERDSPEGSMVSKLSAQNKLLSCDHDYTEAVVQQRCEERIENQRHRFRLPIQTVGPLRLTTPQVRPSVSCSTGFEVDEPRDRAGFNTATLNQLDDTSPWQRVTQQNKEEAVKRVRERLQDLRSDHTEFSSPLHLSSYLMFVHQRHENNDLSCATNYSVMAVLWQAG